MHKAAAPDASERPHAAPFTRRLPATVEELRAQQVEARASGDGDIWCADQTDERVRASFASNENKANVKALEQDGSAAVVNLFRGQGQGQSWGLFFGV